jgi:hypothetical protein
VRRLSENKPFFERLFQQLQKVDIIDPGGNFKFSYMKYLNDCKAFMPFVVEKIDDDAISLAHFTLQNGDVMYDPEIEIKIDPKEKTAEAYTYRNDFVGMHNYYIKGAFRDEDMILDATQFCIQWIDNFQEQGYTLSESYPIDE